MKGRYNVYMHMIILTLTSLLRQNKCLLPAALLLDPTVQGAALNTISKLPGADAAKDIMGQNEQDYNKNLAVTANATGDIPAANPNTCGSNPLGNDVSKVESANSGTGNNVSESGGNKKTIKSPTGQEGNTGVTISSKPRNDNGPYIVSDDLGFKRKDGSCHIEFCVNVPCDPKKDKT